MHNDTREMQMKQIYRTEIQMTYEEYKKMCWTLRRRKAILISSIVSAVLLACGILLCLSGALEGGIYIAGAAAYPILVYVLYAYTMRKNYFSQKTPENRVARYEFTSDRVVLQTSASRAEIMYASLYKVLETKTHFYLLVSASQSFAVRKDLCEQGLLDLLHGLCKRN
jgi:hypothetical protein